jgi:hypothetical protein
MRHVLSMLSFTLAKGDPPKLSAIVSTDITNTHTKMPVRGRNKTVPKFLHIYFHCD